jgi:hypothetical protein
MPVISLVGAIGLSLVVSLGLMSQNIDPENGWGLILAFSAPWIATGWLANNRNHNQRAMAQELI